LSYFPEYHEVWVNKALEEKMELAQEITTHALSLRKKEDVRVRQPLNKIIVATVDENMRKQIREVEDLIMSEINVKAIDYMEDTSDIVVKSIKPDFKKLGPRYGKKMKAIKEVVENLDQETINQLEKAGSLTLDLEGESIELGRDDVELITEDIPGWLVATTGQVTMALDVTITEALQNEGLARELVNRIQNLRKSQGLAVTDHINIALNTDEAVSSAVEQFHKYISRETLARELNVNGNLKNGETVRILEHDTVVKLEKA